MDSLEKSMWEGGGPPRQPNLEVLLKSDLWSSIVILWMLCGGPKDTPNWMEIIFYAGEYPERDYGFVSMLSRKLNDANFEGRFGDGSGCAIHPLRAIDWFESENIVRFVEDAEERDFNLPRWFYELIDAWGNKREPLEDCLIEIDFEDFAKADFWTLAEFTILLFGEPSAKYYSRDTYHQYKPHLETQINKISYHLWVGVEKEIVSMFSPEFDDCDADISCIPKRPKLVFDERVYLDSVDSLYTPTDLLQLLSFKGYPVPEGVIESLKDGDWGLASHLFNQLRINMVNLTKPSEGRLDVISKYSLEGECSSDGDQSINAEPEIIFERRGDYWRVALSDDEPTLIANCKGMSYIRWLLSYPDKDIHCLKLINFHGADLTPESIGNIFSTYENPEELNNGYPKEHGDDILDSKAIRDYKNKIKELSDRRDEIQTTITDPAQSMEETQTIQREIKSIEGRLKKDTGLRWESRQFTSPGERARSSVSHAIRTAIKNISEHAPRFGEFLNRTIQTGYDCRYSATGK